MKNQQRIGISNTGKRYVYHPKEVEQYKKDAFYQLKSQFNKSYGGVGFNGKVSLTAVYFLEKDNRDLNNINAIVWDCLQEAGIIKNDKDIFFNREAKIIGGEEKVFLRLKNFNLEDFNIGLFVKKFYTDHNHITDDDMDLMRAIKHKN